MIYRQDWKSTIGDDVLRRIAFRVARDEPVRVAGGGCIEANELQQRRQEVIDEVAYRKAWQRAHEASQASPPKRRRPTDAFRCEAEWLKIKLDERFAWLVLWNVLDLLPPNWIWPRPVILWMAEDSGPGGRIGDANLVTHTIRIWKKGRDLATLLHEIAHLLAGWAGAGHDAAFYASCDRLEAMLFPKRVSESKPRRQKPKEKAVTIELRSETQHAPALSVAQICKEQRH